MIVLIAIDPDKDVLCNVIDERTGLTPRGFSANWRNIEHIENKLLKN